MPDPDPVPDQASQAGFALEAAGQPLASKLKKKPVSSNK
jgi:hypothetical protein